MLTSAILAGWNSLRPLAEDWERILRSCTRGVHGPDATCSFAWAEALAHTHLRDADIRTLVAYSDGRVVGILPTYAPMRTLFRSRELRAITEAYSGRGAMVVQDSDPAIVRFCLERLVADLPGWDYFVCGIVDTSASEAVVLEAVQQLGLRIRRIGENRSPYIELATWDETLARLPKKMRWTIKKSEKDLASLGKLRYLHLTSSDSVEQLLKYIYAVERKSWKEESGTSITAVNHQQQFYDAATAFLAKRGILSAHLLLLGEEPIAYILGVCASDGVFLDLKESFDAAFAEHSPGHVLKRFAMENLSASGVSTYDFMGACEPYKMRWTDKTYQRSTLVVYNDTWRGSLQFLRSTFANKLPARRASRPPDGSIGIT